MADRPDITQLDYPSLKKYAAEIGVNATGSRAELEEKINAKWSAQDAGSDSENGTPGSDPNTTTTPDNTSENAQPTGEQPTTAPVLPQVETPQAPQSVDMSAFIKLMMEQQSQIAELTKKFAELSMAKPSQPAFNGAQFEENYKTKVQRMKENLDSQPKKTIMVPLDGKEKPGTIFTVILNGYPIYIPKNTYVDVPEQVAQVIMESQNQTRIAEQGIIGDKNYNLAASADRAEALG